MSPRAKSARALAVAILGSDGTRPVVWGLGPTRPDAEEDAARWIAESGDDATRETLGAVEVSPEAVALVRAGEVAVEIASERNRAAAARGDFASLVGTLVVREGRLVLEATS